MVELKKVRKVYHSKKGPDTEALHNINVTMGNRGLVFIVGKSGSGKSTLLNLLGGLDLPTEGNIIVDKKDLTKLNPRQMDAYRNSCVGFIFQEFYILEEYNVYENIELALKLQRKKYELNEIDQLLEKLGIAGLGKRKINELSGGQKQRVAIARALIKDPHMILADEPTGNLDEESSEQIFNILKKISSEKLVVVISHDRESAEKYADRIIELKDGNIVSDTRTVEQEDTEKEHTFYESKLPMYYAMKMALSSMKQKPLKLFFTVFLMMFSLIFMGITLNTTIYDRTQLQIKVMQDNNDYVYRLNQMEFQERGSIETLPFPTEDKKKLENEVGSKLNLSYVLYDRGTYLSFSYSERDENDPYFVIEPTYLNFIEVEDERVIGDVIGRLPETPNELVIHKYLAEYMIKYGVKDSKGELYHPKDIQALVKEGHQLQLGDNVVVIVGVVDDDTSFYEKAKKEGNMNDRFNMYLYDEYAWKGRIIYGKNFVGNVKLHSDQSSVLSNLMLNVPMVTTFGSLEVLSTPSFIITKEGMVTKEDLAVDEVVISIEDLRSWMTDYDTQLNQYLKDHPKESYEVSLQNFLVQYLKSHEDLLKLEIVGNQSLVSFEDRNVKVVGISMEGKRYIGTELLQLYQPNLKQAYEAYVYDSNPSSLEKTFQTYPPIDEKTMTGVQMITEPPHGEDVKWLVNLYYYLNPFLAIVSLVFVLFTIVLFTNFIAISISYCKKEIGILRAIGTKQNDIIQIFGYESLFIGFIAYILAIIGWYVVIHLLNGYFFGDFLYNFNGMIHQPIVVLAMLIFTIIISFGITVLSISKVIRIKPIDAILNK